MRINKNLLVIIVMAILSNFSAELYVPSLPAISKDLVALPSLIQLTVGMYILGAGLAQSVYGSLSDFYGRKKVLMFGMAIGVVGGFICVFSRSGAALLAGRFIQGIGLASCISIMRAIIRDIYSGSNMSRVTSYISICMEIATILAPIIGSYIQYYFGWRMNFIALTLMTLGSLGIAYYLLNETNQNRGSGLFSISDSAKQYLRLLKDYTFIGYALCATFAAAGIYMYLAVSSFLFENTLGFSAVQYSWVMVSITITLVIGGFLSSLIVTKLSTAVMVFIGCALMLLSGIVMCIPGLFNAVNVWLILVPTLIFMLGASFVFPNALTGALRGYSSSAGSAAALYGTCQLIGSFLCTLAISTANTSSQAPLGFAYICVGIFSLFSLFLAINFQRFENVGVQLAQ